MPPLDAVVTGVGGAVSGPAEARILLLGAVAAEDIVASAAFRLRVVGGMVPASVWSVGTVSYTAQEQGTERVGGQYDSTARVMPPAAVQASSLGQELRTRGEMMESRDPGCVSTIWRGRVRKVEERGY